MSMSKIPVYLTHMDLFKTQGSAGTALGQTNFVPGVQEVLVDCPPGVQPSYRAPEFRENGNAIFRRNVFNELDVEWSVLKIARSIFEYKQGVQLSPESSVILQTIFPGVFAPADGTEMAYARFNLRLSPEEITVLRNRVALFLQHAMTYRMGLTGAGPHGDIPNTGI